MRHFILFLLSLGATTLSAQTSADWDLLGEVRYQRGLDLRTGYMIDRPKFSGQIKRLEDEKIEIKGYILPLDAEGKSYVLSKYPYAACFFCGGGGLESVMNIWFSDLDTRYKLDQVVTLSGTLRLNDTGDGLIYLLEDAAEIE